MRLLSSIRKPFRYTYSNASLVIIGINIAVFLLSQMFAQLPSFLALNVINVVRNSMYWQFFTYMFVHGGVTHLVFNMLALFFFGVSVEKAVGSKEFVLFYAVCGTGGGIVSFLVYLFSGMQFVFLLGASGAVFAVLLAYAVLFPRSQIYIWGVLPVPAPVLVIVYTGLEIVSGIFMSGSGISHMTHLAGFAFGWLYFMVRMGVNPWSIWKKTLR
jgi:membrane associated rhomboid family serine protease